MTFRYSDNDRSEILSSLTSDDYFWGEKVSDDDFIRILEKEATAYIHRVQVLDCDLIKRRILSLKTVLAMLTEPKDQIHRERILLELNSQNWEMGLVERRRDRKARLEFMIQAYHFYLLQDHIIQKVYETPPSWEFLRELIPSLSDAKTPLATFFEHAIFPACKRAFRNEASNDRMGTI